MAKENQLLLQMRAGQDLLIDNHRVLHGQTAFAEVESRLMRGAYAEQDGLRSELRRLRQLRKRSRGYFADGSLSTSYP